jgi:hypothetical protein
MPTNPDEYPKTTPEAQQSLAERMLKAGWAVSAAVVPGKGLALELTTIGRHVFSDLRALFIELEESGPLSEAEAVALYVLIAGGSRKR